MVPGGELLLRQLEFPPKVKAKGNRLTGASVDARGCFRSGSLLTAALFEQDGS